MVHQLWNISRDDLWNTGAPSDTITRWGRQAVPCSVGKLQGCSQVGAWERGSCRLQIWLKSLVLPCNRIMHEWWNVPLAPAARQAWDPPRNARQLSGSNCTVGSHSGCPCDTGGGRRQARSCLGRWCQSAKALPLGDRLRAPATASAAAATVRLPDGSSLPTAQRPIRPCLTRRAGGGSAALILAAMALAMAAMLTGRRRRAAAKKPAGCHHALV